MINHSDDLRVEDIAERTGLHVETIRAALRSGALRGYQQGSLRRWYATEADVAAWEARLTAKHWNDGKADGADR